MTKRLAWSRPPIAGESLMGFVARNADIHAADKVSAVLRAAGIETIVPESLPTTHRDKAADIAALFVTTPAEISLRTYPPVDPPGGSGTCVSFFGTPLRSLYLEMYRRRVSPTSLARSAHHRALWDIRPFAFCPESRETLISSCPVCSADLGWRWTFGPAFCEICGADLREFPQPKVEVADDAALDFVVDLIHPDPSRKEKAMASAGTAFDRIGVDRGELFEFAMALASTLAADPADDSSKIRRGNSVVEYARLAPTLSEAGRVILDWPRGFETYLDGMRSRMAGGAGGSGPMSQFGPARLLKDDRHLAPALRKEIRRRINDCLGNPSWRPMRVIRADGELGSADSAAPKTSLRRSRPRRRSGSISRSSRAGSKASSVGEGLARSQIRDDGGSQTGRRARP